jgi:hypothetical protein
MTVELILSQNSKEPQMTTSKVFSKQSTEPSSEARELCSVAVQKLLAYCRQNNWAGDDPYDAMSSELFKVLPILNSKIPRLVLTQTLKRIPINLRRLLRIPKTQNPKALALFMSTFLMLTNEEAPDREELIEYMIKRLIELRSPDIPYWCWGYSFHWQGRNMLVPMGSPNLVCTYFVANSLLEVYKQRRDPRCLTMAVSAAEYILNELYWTNGPVVSFSYPLPSVRSQVYNANLLAAALFCRVAKHTGETRFLGPALKAARYAAEQQQPDGSWFYGELPWQRWVDNFHTGYNLGALRSIARDTGTTEFDERIRRGLAFYKNHFFREDGAPRYFHNRTYPIDTHCAAQAIISLVEFKDVDPGNIPLAESVFRWTMKHLWDKQGFFYYRVLRTCTIKTSYMRWTQVWMFLALVALLRSYAAPVETAKPAPLAGVGV